MSDTSFETIIIGGSYAGLSAAMTLGRARRKTLVLDAGKPCNRQTPHAHNLITHDGDRPTDIVRQAREQVLAYPMVRFVSGTAGYLSGKDGAFEVTTKAGESYNAQKIILATGVQDIPLPIDGFAECWGISVLHCPYCHGYEVADAPLGVLANGPMAFEFARLIRQWSQNLALFTNGLATLSAAQIGELQARGIAIVEKELAAIVHQDGYLHHLVFTDGTKQPLRAVFARGGIALPDFIHQTGCAVHTEGMFTGLVQTDDFGKTTVPGIYAAGDCCHPMRSLANAMAAGMKVGAMVNHELVTETF